MDGQIRKVDNRGKNIDQIDPEMLAAKERLWQQYRDKKWFTGCGIGEGGILITVREEGDIDNAPRSYEGWPTDIRVCNPVVF